MKKVIWHIGITLTFCFAFLLKISGTSFSDFPDNLIFDNVTTQDNSYPSVVEAFAQDKFGFIWIGAKDGLYRYDGIEFDVYTFHRRDPHSLSSNVVSYLYTDSKGNLWVGTENGLNLYNVHKDNFTRFTTNEGLPDNNIRSITEDDDGNLWIATRTGGIVRKSAGTNQFTPLQDLLKGGKEYLAKDTRCIFLNGDTLWIGTVHTGIRYLTLDEMILHSLELKTDRGDSSEMDIRSIGIDGEENLWFGTNRNGLLRFDPETNIITHFSSQYQGPFHISSDNIWYIVRDSRGILWVATDGGGLDYLVPGQEAFKSYRHSRKDESSINSDAVRILFEDRACNFWIGHYNATIDYVNTDRKKFHTVKDFMGDESQYIVTAVLEDQDQNLWYATDGSGLIFDKKGQGIYTQFRAQKGSGQSVLSNKPMCLEEDSHGNIWMGYYDGGISCYLKDEKRFVHYPKEIFGEFQGNQVWDLLIEGDSLWIASQNGLHVMDLDSKKIQPQDLEGPGDTFDHQETLCLLRDSRGRMLIATYKGLFVFQNNDLQAYTYSPTDMSSLSDKWIITLFEDSKKRIWVGTNNGLNLWKENGKFVCFTMDDGLPGNSISAIMEDKDGNLWISTNGGLSKFNYDKKSYTNYFDEDGLQGNRFRANANFYSRDGNLYFGGDHGITSFKPEEIEPCEFMPPVVFTDLRIIDNKGQNKREKPSISENILTAKEIHIYPGQNIFTLDFASLNYTQGHRNQYMYRLEGFEEGWHKVGNQNHATYTNLAPGTYTFRVRGSNHDGIWNKHGSSIRIVVHPPFYKRYWFIGLMILLAGLIIFSIYKLRVRTIERQNLKLARLVGERTQQLEKRNTEIAEQNERIIKQRDLATVQRDQIVKQKEELEKHRSRLEELVEERTQDLVVAKEIAEESDRLKTAFLENLSHEIRTPMNAIIGFINLLAEKIDDKFSREYYLRIINNSGKSMLRLIQDIVDFSRMQTGQLQPEYSSCSVNNLLRDLITITRGKASREKPDLNIVADLPEKEIIMYTDAKKLNQIFSKLLENSIKYTEKGHITVGIEKLEAKWITFFVRDTGIGIKPEHIDKIFDRFFTVAEDDKTGQERGSGLGLAFAKVITELLGGKIWAESHDGIGSTFYFMIPFKAMDAEVEKKAKPDEKRFSWDGKKILVAEDEESNFLLIEAILRDTGVSIIHCEDGVELLERVDDGLEFDLVLLDLKMPRMGGINAMKLIRESNKDIPVIVQTAYDQTNHRKQCLEVGCNDFLVKPLRKKELLETIEKYLG